MGVSMKRLARMVAPAAFFSLALVVFGGSLATVSAAAGGIAVRRNITINLFYQNGQRIPSNQVSISYQIGNLDLSAPPFGTVTGNPAVVTIFLPVTEASVLTIIPTINGVQYSHATYTIPASAQQVINLYEQPQRR
jgi:hypothetical protein